MRAPHTPETRERCRVLVETTTRGIAEIAAEVGVGDDTVRRWMKRYGWTRPAGLEPKGTKLPRRKYPALQAVYENRATLTDIAVVAGCSMGHLNKVAMRERWARREASAESPPPANAALSGALADVEAALREPDLGRRDFLRLLDRAMALTAADALAGRPGVERAAQTLTRLAGAAKTMPDDTPPVAPALGRIIHPGEPEDSFPDANDLIEEIARRVEQAANDWLDPRILAILAETVP